jgi:hypothetical protein
VDDEKEGGPRGPEGGGGWVTHGSRGMGVTEDDMMGAGPTLAKHRVVENDGSVRASLIRVLRSRPSKSCIHDFGPPPPSA